MSLAPLLRPRILPIAISAVRTVRSTRASIKIGKDRFELYLDVRNFRKNEIQVKAHPKYVTIEGKSEKRSENECIISQFTKRYRLPDGCIIKKMESRLSPEGILSVTAPRACGDPDICNTIVIPVQTGDPNKEDNKEPEQKVYSNPCEAYLKVKPKPPTS